MSVARINKTASTLLRFFHSTEPTEVLYVAGIFPYWKLTSAKELYPYSVCVYVVRSLVKCDIFKINKLVAQKPTP